MGEQNIISTPKPVGEKKKIEKAKSRKWRNKKKKGKVASGENRSSAVKGKRDFCKAGKANGDLWEVRGVASDIDSDSGADADPERRFGVRAAREWLHDPGGKLPRGQVGSGGWEPGS